MPASVRSLVLRMGELKKPEYLYVVEFVDGLLKVGRTTDRIARMRTYEMEGKKITRRHFSQPCSYSAIRAEWLLVRQCRRVRIPACGSEWFRNLSFDTVVRWVNSFSCDESACEIFDRESHGPSNPKARAP